MGEQTSIPVTRDVRDELAETKPDGMSWSEYLLALRDESDQLWEMAQGFGGVMGDDDVAIVGSNETIVDDLAERLSDERDVTLEAAERRAIAEEVAEVLGR